jgi:hypothetical protein
MRKAMISGLVLAAMALVVPVSALAEGIVPPGNSAASQYTEAFPTAVGEKDSEGKKKPDRSPSKVLGPRKARELEEQGSAGEAVADFAAETSPDPVAPSAEQKSGSPDGKKKAAGKSGESEGNGGEQSGVTAGNGSGSGPGGGTLVSDSGSSGFGEVVGQATGTTDSGKLGLLLPLILAGAAIWAFAFYWRSRQKQRVA